MTTDIEAVLFDADGVIQRTANGWRPELEALCPDPEAVDRFLADVFAAERPSMTGEGDFAEALAGVLRRWDSPVPVERALRAWTLVEPDPGMLALVHEVRAAGAVVALATNQQAYRAAHMSEGLGYAKLFDHLLYSCALGHAKPSPGFFTAAVARIGLPADRLLFLDDQEQNVAAAREAGLAAKLFSLGEDAGAARRILSRHGVLLN